MHSHASADSYVQPCKLNNFEFSSAVIGYEQGLKDSASNQRFWCIAKTCKLIGTDASVKAEDTVLVVLIVDGFR